MEELFLSAAACTVHGINDVKRTEIHTEEPLVPEPSPFESEMAIEKLYRQVTR